MLGLPPLPRTLGAALRDVEHAKEHVRLSALGDLVRLARLADSREKALAALERALARDASAALRAEAAVGLADAEAESARDALLAALDDRDARVRQMAVLALGEIAAVGDAKALPRLRALLSADEPALRFQALIAIERVAPAEAPSAVLRAATDADDEVRTMAFRVAGRRFSETDAVPQALVAAARRALSDGVTSVRATAALFLAARGEAEAHGVVVGVIDGSVPIAAVEDLQSAIELSVMLGLGAARPGLARRAFGPLGLRSDPIAWHASIALARLGDERARRAILRGLGAWTFDARTLAVAAAGHAGLVEARARIESFRGDPRRAAPEAVEEALRTLAGEIDPAPPPDRLSVP